MKKLWKIEVRIDEELEGWSEADQFTAVEIEDEVSNTLIKVYDNIEGMDLVDCHAEEVKKDE